MDYIVNGLKWIAANNMQFKNQEISSMEYVEHDTSGSTLDFGWARNKENCSVHVNDVPNGLKCGCHCPECGGQLIARQGKSNAWHFAHYDHKNDCPGAAETALHLAAKEILKDLKGRILLPEEIIRKKGWPKPPIKGEYDRRSYFRKKLDKKMMYKYKARHISSDWLVELEPTDWLKSDNHGFRPDAVLTKNGCRLLVEIRVTNAVDAEKRTLLRKSGLGAIEINLEDIDRNISRSDLEKLIRKNASRKWLSTGRPKSHKTKEDEFTKILEEQSNILNKVNLRKLSINENINECPRRDNPGYASVNTEKCNNCDYNKGNSYDFCHTPLYELLDDKIKSRDKPFIFCSHRNVRLNLPTENQKQFVRNLAKNDLKTFRGNNLKNYLPVKWEQNLNFCKQFIDAHYKCTKCNIYMVLIRDRRNMDDFLWECPDPKMVRCREINNSIAPVIKRILDSIPKILCD